MFTPENFINWLDELLSFNPELTSLDARQTKMVKDKLALVFNKVTPDLNLFSNNPLDIPNGKTFQEIMTGEKPTEPTYCNYVDNPILDCNKVDLLKEGNVNTSC